MVIRRQDGNMESLRNLFFILVFLILFIGHLCAQELSITNVSFQSPNTISFGWTSVTDHYILASCPDLTTSRFEYIGYVLSTNWTLLTNDATMSFFRVNKTVVVDFPDPILRTAVSNAIVAWYAPRDLIYDVELQDITILNIHNSAITNTTGLTSIPNLQQLRCQNDQLTSLDVSGLAALDQLYCSFNQLTNLNLSACSNLTRLECDNNLVPKMDLSSCTNIEFLFCQVNLLSALIVTNMTKLHTLNCSANQIATLDVSGLQGLRGFNTCTAKATNW